MCGRFTLTASGEVVAEFFDLAGPPPGTPRYNIAPTQPAPVIRAEARDRLDWLHWGLIPSWAKDPQIGNRMINARAETVDAKPAFRGAFKHRRCLVVADGFYEWQKQPGQKRKQPYYVRMRDAAPFAFAGLWEHWEDDEGTAIESCVILTTEPNALMKTIHDRMPVILRPEDYAKWLDPAGKDTARTTSLLVPHSPEPMIAFPVGTLVNSPANDVAACVEPVGE